MSAVLGALAGATAGAGAWVVADRVRAVRRGPSLVDRVEPYLGRVAAPRTDHAPLRGLRALTDPWLRSGAVRLDAVLGGSASVQARLVQSGSDRTVTDFRLEQLAWGAAAFGSTFAFMVIRLASGSSLAPVAAAFVCVAAAVAGVLACDQRLTATVRGRQARVEAELPTLVELLALAVSAGDGAIGSLERVSRAGSGDLAGELRRTLDDVRGGVPLTVALSAMSDRLGVDAVSRFVDAVTVAVDRGTPLADVLRAQAADARDLRRRRLMESAGRREIAMLVPVVFLILPVTVLFALYPGFYGLRLSVA